MIGVYIVLFIDVGYNGVWLLITLITWPVPVQGARYDLHKREVWVAEMESNLCWFFVVFLWLALNIEMRTIIFWAHSDFPDDFWIKGTALASLSFHALWPVCRSQLCMLCIPQFTQVMWIFGSRGHSWVGERDMVLEIWWIGELFCISSPTLYRVGFTLSFFFIAENGLARDQASG